MTLATGMRMVAAVLSKGNTDDCGEIYESPGETADENSAATEEPASTLEEKGRSGEYSAQGTCE
ncbi:hypothetical protein H4217_001237 [Coemansia sp. RSA 1939]|nr:hypothetical protein H4217_001237 [Coemansia sp. RSA 1939]